MYRRSGEKVEEDGGGVGGKREGEKM